MVVDAEPPGWVVTLNELLEATPLEQPYVTASVMPTSAVCGSQESSAFGPAVEIHCQPVTQAPVYVARQVPVVQAPASGCLG